MPLRIRCEQVRALPTCVEGTFRNSTRADVTVARADIVGFGRPGGTLQVAQPQVLSVLFKSRYDRLKRAMDVSPPLQMRIPLQVA